VLFVWLRWLRVAVIASALAAGATGVLVSLFQDRFVYHPERTLPRTPAAAHLEYADVALTTSDGVRLHGWHVRASSPRALVVVFHGNAGNIAGRIPMAEAFARERLETLLVDYRGFGRSEGKPSEEGLYRDGEAAWAWAARQSLPVVLYGESLGGAVAIEIAAHHRPALLVAQSTFTSLKEMAGRLFPLGDHLVRERYASLEKIGRVTAPVLVVHGDRDELVPYEMGRRLFEAVRGPKQLMTVRGAGHNDLFGMAGGEVARKIAVMLGGE
jgi:uncharacterized protein